MTKMQQEQNEYIKLLANRIFYAVTGGAIVISLSISGMYYGLKAEMAADRTESKVRSAIVDGKFNNIDTRLQSLETSKNEIVSAK